MNPKPFEFEKSLKELEEITAWFESSDIDLDAGVAKFERGLELASLLKTHLASIENRVEKIRERFSAQTLPEVAGPAQEADTAGQTDLFGA